MSNIIYAFDCPVHGRKTSGYCFRAFNKENRDKWKRLKVTYTPVKFDEDELNGYLSFLTTLYSRRSPKLK